MVPYNQLRPHQLPPFIKLKNADGTEDIHYSVFYDSIPEEFNNMARVELNETEEKKRNGIQRLRAFLKEEGISGVEDTVLVSCLRKCKYNFNKVETELSKCLKTQQEIMDDLQKIDIKKLEHVLDHNVVGILPYRDKKGRAIFFTTPNFHNLELYDMEDASLCVHLNLMFLLSFPMTSIAGLVYIAEAKLPTTDIVYPIMKTIRRHLGCLASFPGRLAKIEILNELFIVRWTVNLIKPLLTAKSIDRLNFHGGDVISLQKTYHPDILPEEFGGNLGPLNNTFYKEELMKFIKRFKNENAICINN